VWACQSAWAVRADEQSNWLDHFVVSVGHRCQPDRKPARRAGTAALAGSRHRRSGVYGC
jgi:hypothetical protein